MVDETRRRLLKYTACLAAAVSAEDTGVDTDQLLEPDDEAGVVTHSTDNTSQYRGDERNTGYKERSDGKSPKSVDRVRELGTLTGGEFIGPPVTTPGGQYAVPGMNVVGLASSGGTLTELPANGETTNPIFIGETELSFGDDAIRLFDTTTGAETDKIDYFTGSARDAFAKYDGKAYKGRSNGIEKVDLDSFSSDKLNNIENTSKGNLLLLDEGKNILKFDSGDLIKYDINNETELARDDVKANAAGISTDGDYVFATSSDETLAYDAETLDKVASADREGVAAGPPPIADNGDVTEIYTEAKNEGIIYAEEVDEDTEEFTRKWETDVGDFAAIDLVYQDVAIGSTDERIFGLNKDTGKELWSMEQAAFIGIPYDDKLPAAGIDGTLYELDMNMEELGTDEDCVPRRQVSRGQENRECETPVTREREELEDRTPRR